jgi:thiamine transport system ATP-binding protein
MLEARDLTLHFGPVAALDGFHLLVPDGHVVSVLGPSGCGKSTLLRVVAGLQAVEAGEVLWDGMSLRDTQPHRRGFGLMFQDYSLFPHKTVAGNVAFGLRMAGMDRTEVSHWVDAAQNGWACRATATGPRQSLRGEAQRWLARARSRAPPADARRASGRSRPHSAERLLGELRQLFADLGISYSRTHDREAFALADHAWLCAGRVEQEGEPGFCVSRGGKSFLGWQTPVS